LDLHHNFSSHPISKNHSKNTCKKKTKKRWVFQTRTIPNTEWNTKQESLKPQTKDMQVLGVMHQGANTFEKIQRSLKMESKDLDSIYNN